MTHLAWVTRLPWSGGMVVLSWIASNADLSETIGVVPELPTMMVSLAMPCDVPVSDRCSRESEDHAPARSSRGGPGPMPAGPSQMARSGPRSG